MSKKLGDDRMTPGALVIAETNTSTWNYHLRRIGSDGRLYMSGGAPPALCGRSLGWDTKQPVSSWGKKSHLPLRWCSDCAEVASDELLKTALLPAIDIAQKGLRPDGYVAAVNFTSIKTLEGRPRYKTKVAAAKNAAKDLGLAPGDAFIVGLLRRSTSFANGCFTEVFVLGDVAGYELRGGRPVAKTKLPTKKKAPVKKKRGRPDE